MRFGIKEKIIEQIQSVFFKYPQVETVILYGSRAKDNYKNGSDIDFTFKGKNLTISILYKIEEDLDEFDLPYSFDLSIYVHIDNEKLREHINRVGTVFYEKGKGVLPDGSVGV